jgi:hypothetical protein
MRTAKCLRRAQKELNRGSRKQPKGAAQAYSGILKTLASAEICF